MKYLNDISYKDCVGKVFKSLNSGDFKIVKYNNVRNVEIQFLKIVGDDLGHLIIQSESVVEVAKNLGHLIMQFRNGTGWNYDDYIFEVTQSSNGKKYKHKKFQMVFDTLEAYIVFYTESKISNKDFKYEVE